MILKVYIKKHLFHLPRKQDDLTELIKKKLYQNKKLVKSAITKMYSISKVDNEYISIEPNTNIFLLNLYLLVLQEKGGLAFTEKINLNNKILLQKIKQTTNIEITSESIEEIEELVLNCLYPKNNAEVEANKKETKEVFNNIKYSIAWVKKANKHL